MLLDGGEITLVSKITQPTNIAKLKTEYNLFYMDEFLSSVEKIQAYSFKNTRMYLAHLCEQAFFEIVSPITGHTIKSGSSLLLRDKTVIYSFPDEPDIFVATGDLGAGFPICAAILNSRKLLVRLTDNYWGFNPHHVSQVNKAAEISGWVPGPNTERTNIIIGDANFAHHAWNELSCLEDLISTGLIDKFQFIVPHEPLGRLEEIFPAINADRISRIYDHMIENANRPGALLFPLGGQIITTSLIEKVMSYAHKHISDECSEMLHRLSSKSGPMLWISVRTRNRTASNQKEALVAIGQEFLRRAPDGYIILDGFSFGATNDREPDYFKENSRIVAEADRAEAEQISQQIKRSEGEDRVQLATGLSVTDSILLSRLAHFYVCHHGTVQHKIGWFNKTPGVVHCNTKVLKSRPATWVASKSEAACIPSYVPEEIIRDLPLEGEQKLKATLPDQDNYTIENINDFVAFFVKCATSVNLFT